MSGSGEEREALSLAKAGLTHRGPDELGEYSSDGARLFIARLAIIDLTSGVTPVENENGKVAAVMNGEIYNHVELSRLLSGKNHILKTKTDTEVLPHLYEEHGAHFCNNLRGMFAVALWDVRRQRLLLARDRFGKKPLYYVRLDSGGVLFASEIKALRNMMSPSRFSIRDQAVYDYLSLGFIPQPSSIYEGVQPVPPGCSD